MTNEQKYSAVLKELGAVLEDKNATITCQRWEIDELKKKLKEAEKTRDYALGEIDVMAGRLAQAKAEIEVLKGGAA